MVLIFKKGRQKGIVLKGKRAFIFQRGYKVFCIGRFYKGGAGLAFYLMGGVGKMDFFVPNVFFNFYVLSRPGFRGGYGAKSPLSFQNFLPFSTTFISPL